ncbi:hypothetical protein [Vibrio anguillarum]|uniref:Uncharacterized protein n=1 Tax=Vibrio anguillarum TaxID=55601 RepID=A0ABR9Z7Q7_VIBAN|nr:hypothetical protein [Vibrio anguillarum]MBF4374480.1 hypothetical protein [Vibrio anguillarum]
MMNELTHKHLRRSLSQLTHLAFWLSTQPQSPLYVPPSILRSYSFSTLNKPQELTSYGGVKEGTPFVEYSLCSIYNDRQMSGLFTYQEEIALSSAFPILSDLSLTSYLSCLVSHETAHACVFYVDCQSKRSFSEAHGERWQLIYRFVRDSLLFIVSSIDMNYYLSGKGIWTINDIPQPLKDMASLCFTHQKL